MATLAVRMKKYEKAYNMEMTERLPVIIRIDGKGFSQYTKNMEKPFDQELAEVFWETAKFLASTEHVAGCKLAYHQSDEISLLLNNYEKENTQSWFENDVQKMASVVASLATGKFNEEMQKRNPSRPIAFFDARVFVVPHDEVANYFLWRQRDATKNSVSMVAQAHFHQNQLQGLKGNQLQDKLYKEKGINWNDLPVWQKRGICIIRKNKTKETIRNGETIHTERKVWEVDEDTPIFSKNRNYIEKYI